MIDCYCQSVAFKACTARFRADPITCAGGQLYAINCTNMFALCHVCGGNGHSQSLGCDILQLNQQGARSATNEPLRTIPKLCWFAAPAQFRSAHIDQAGQASMGIEGLFGSRTCTPPVKTRACSRKIGAGPQPCLYRVVDLAGPTLCNPATIAMIGDGGRLHRSAKVECWLPTLNGHTMDCSVTAPGRARPAVDRLRKFTAADWTTDS